MFEESTQYILEQCRSNIACNPLTILQNAIKQTSQTFSNMSRYEDTFDITLSPIITSRQQQQQQYGTSPRKCLAVRNASQRTLESSISSLTIGNSSQHSTRDFWERELSSECLFHQKTRQPTGSSGAPNAVFPFSQNEGKGKISM